MSAIYGIWYKDGAPRAAQALAQMAASLADWGPDGHGEWQQNEVALGHAKLCVTPESRHEQMPLALAIAPEVVITADARIDNRAELAAALRLRSVEERHLGDGELILHAYHKWGEGCAAHLVGDFAFAIWDGAQRKLFCARDHIGCRPFFYFDSPRMVVFASDLPAILAVAGVPRQLHAALLAARLQQHTYWAERRHTYFEGIVKVPPAHQLEVTVHATRLTEYWGPEALPAVRLSSDAAYAEQLRALLEQAVADRTRTEFPVGSHISGGLDSTTVAVLTARQMREQGQQPHGFSWSPTEERQAPVPGDERVTIGAVASAEAMKCHFIALTRAETVDLYSQDFTVQPTAMMLSEHYVQAQAAAQGVRVMLSGWGGDEFVTFNGRGYFAELLVRGRWRRLHREIAVRTLGDVQGWRAYRNYLLQLYFRAMHPLLPEWLWETQATLRGKARQAQTFILPEVATKQRAAVRALGNELLRERAGLRAMQCLVLRAGHLTTRMESWAIQGARRGIVYSYPLLDRRIIEFCLGIPSEQFVRDGWARFLFRRAIAGLVPSSIQWSRSKDDPAAQKVLYQVSAQLQPALAARLWARGDDHPAATWLDMPALRQAIEREALTSVPSAAVGPALSCFAIDPSIFPTGTLFPVDNSL